MNLEFGSLTLYIRACPSTLRIPPLLRIPPPIRDPSANRGGILSSPQAKILGKSGGNEEKVKEKAPQAKKIAFWAPRRGAKTSKMKEKAMKIGQNRLFRRSILDFIRKPPPFGGKNL